jgi:hypothetical protein
MLRNLVMEEVAKLKSKELDSDAAKETDADELADSLENHIDYVKALKIKEARLLQQLRQVRESKQKAYRRILSSR